MKQDDEIREFDDEETEELNIEDLTEVQGGIEDMIRRGDCGLGCFLGAGYGPNIR